MYLAIQKKLENLVSPQSNQRVNLTKLFMNDSRQ